MYGNGGLFDDFKNAWSRPNNGLIQLIMINVIIFVALIIFKVILVLSGNPDVYQTILRQFMLPASIDSFIVKPWTLLSYFFTHEGFFHIIFNMLFLFWFGKIIVEYLGDQRAISMYVIGGIVGGLFYILIYNLIPYFHERVAGSVMLGASAGVYAIVVGAATFMPNYTFFLLFLGPVKIKYIAIFYILLSFSQTIGANAGGELAHLGGALMGFIFIRQLQRGNDIGTPVVSVMEWFKGLFKPSPKIRVTHKSTKFTGTKKASSSNTKSDQDEIDAILDKISHSGYESLSKEEKQKLFNASKK
ncbi:MULTISPECIES: rhomboid family intramembrane serine protease [unclassified Imperialibacter]|uniref:rhomboid family intramembrane serine protease n=1 Tax=unclassified Imperialibacter TaxID=2629706 RepID=UPI001254683A|nr:MULTISPECIES: rhomboid family intramembrane serine protease [unclassified Imperialibacter]CAD5274252.1 Membrane associated rhomboid family serine protease [Imperialibacter sp. 75]CAD5287872.1 Membrane associated rhomboid family serine protease [Imperialibacter sp. 89]VVT35564.1 Rhomboid family intramembrane serine protease [Imperialibacter sp. EC-SDR9]